MTLRLLFVFPTGLTMLACLWILLALAAGMIAGMLFGWTLGADTRRYHGKIRVENRQLKKQIAVLTQSVAVEAVQGPQKTAGSMKMVDHKAPK